MARPIKVLWASEEVRTELRRRANGRSTEHRDRFRARIILQCASGKSNAAVARQLKTTGFTVGFWRKRFIAGGMDRLWDEPRPGAPRQVD